MDLQRQRGKTESGSGSKQKVYIAEGRRSTAGEIVWISPSSQAYGIQSVWRSHALDGRSFCAFRPRISSGGVVT